MAKSKAVEEEVVDTTVEKSTPPIDDKQKKTEKKKDKKPAKEKRSFFRKIRESWSELKKVSWPTFANVVKKTGVVILVVFLFTLVLFGIDFGLGWIYKLFLN